MADQPQPKHARKRNRPAAERKNRAAAGAAHKPGAPAKPITPRQAAGKSLGAARTVTERRSYSGRHMLTAELLIGILIVAIRAVSDYEPQADGTVRGKVGHPEGQYGPLPILAGLIVTFFLLSFLAASGGLKAKLAVIAGGIIDLALLLKSGDEFTKVSATWGEFGKAKVPPGDWQTSGTIAGEPVSGTLPSDSGGQGGATAPEPTNGKCPPGWLLDRTTGKCVSDLITGPPKP
jgi:hypothetical protein